jgi:hypothetical protein
MILLLIQKVTHILIDIVEIDKIGILKELMYGINIDLDMMNYHHHKIKI